MSIKKLVSTIVERILDLLAPPFCSYCRKFMDNRDPLCGRCLAMIKLVISKQLPLANGYQLTVHAVGDYKAPLKSLVLAKAQSNRVACKYLAQLIWQFTPIRTIEFDYLLPIPLHWTRYAWRGYNQAEAIAYELSRLSGKPVIAIVKRVKRTLFQSIIAGTQRKKNVADAFAISQNAQRYEGKKFAIIDDLMTTGSTLQAFACTLLDLKPESLHAFVACRVNGG